MWRTLSCLLLLSSAGLSGAETIEVLPVQGSVYMLAGAGGNITFQIGENGVFVVDTGIAGSSDQVIAAIRKLSTKPLKYVVNTDFHDDNTGGNEAFAREGGTSTVVNIVNTPGSTATQTVKMVGHEAILDKMSATVNGKPVRASLAWPTDTFFDEGKQYFFNGESIRVIHQPAAITDGSSLVYFRKSDVIATGDVFMTTGYPKIDLENGGSIQGVLDSLNRILDLTIPAHHLEGGTMVIPGHGRISDEADVIEYRDMLTVIRDRVKAMAKKGMALTQIQQSRPTLDYDGLYDVPRQAADQFVETVYKSLQKEGSR